MARTWQNRVAIGLTGLVIVSLPGGTAIQSIALTLITLAGICLYATQTRSEDGFKLRDTILNSKWVYITYSFFIVWQIFSSWMNPKNVAHDLLPHALGMMAIILAPPFIAICLQTAKKSSRFWLNVATIVFSIWALVALSQAIWGWQLRDLAIDFANHYKRSKGFYSHPLTLAYVSLAIWPLVFNKAIKNKNNWQWKVLAISTATLIVFSQSRTVQICAIAMIIWTLVTSLKGKRKIFAILALLMTIGAVASTKNPLSKRYYEMTEETNNDRFSDYPDDRIAFWHAFAYMIAERPFLGHGIRLDENYRTPYYKKIGLEHFKKKYEAHNQLLQILAESGIIGLSAFLIWLLLSIRMLKKLPSEDRTILFQTILLLLTAGLTQNAFQDSEVRFTITLLLSMGLYQQSLRNLQKIPEHDNVSILEQPEKQSHQRLPA